MEHAAVASLLRWLLQIIAASITPVVAVRAPRTLAVIFLVATLSVYILSLALDMPIDDREPVGMKWIMGLLKSLLVAGASAIPTLGFASMPVTTSRALGRYLACVLGANILWTISFDAIASPCGMLRSCCALALVVSLGIRCRAHRIGAAPIVWKESSDTRIVIFMPVSVLWVSGYTLWNVLFCVETFALHTSFPNLSPWLCVALWRMAGVAPTSIPLVCYWAYARVLALSTYMAVADWANFIPATRGADEENYECSADYGALAVIALLILIADLGLLGRAMWTGAHVAQLSSHSDFKADLTHVQPGHPVDSAVGRGGDSPALFPPVLLDSRPMDQRQESVCKAGHSLHREEVSESNDADSEVEI